MGSHTTTETREILDSIRRIVRGLRASSVSTERDLGISSAQFYVLQKLGEGGPASLNELAARTLTHQSSVSVVASKLARKGLVARRRSREDARRLEITLTARGEALLRDAPEPIQERLIAAIAGLRPATRRTFAAALAELVREAGLGDGPAPLFFEEKQP